ncbi:MAG: hypothetical protein IJ836_05355 [Spirochaetales bacterium]|nr:hypothetical protein [Spirochaetales bacterium]
MKRSTIVTLILSIISLVSSFILKACAIASGFQKVHYEGFGYSYTQIVVKNSAMNQILSAFSHMAFVLGIVLVCVFAYLAVKNPAEKKTEEAEKVMDASEKVESKEEVAEVVVEKKEEASEEEKKSDEE